MRCSLLLPLAWGPLLASCLIGCDSAALQVAPPEVPAVPVCRPAQRMVTDHVDFTGRTDAVQAVDIRARVTGYIERIPFKEGEPVKAGDVLFEIDPRPYQAQLEQAQRQVELNQASLRLARTTYERDRVIASTVSGAVSPQQLDQDKAAVEEAQARVAAAESSRKIYRLNLDFAQVRSPIDGQVGRHYLTRGNLVNQDQTLLTTIVSLDPMHAYFDMDEATLLRIRRARNQDGPRQQAERVQTALLALQVPVPRWTVLAQVPFQEAMPVWMGLQGEEDHPHRGWVDFINNQVNPATGSIAMRGVFANPLPPGGARLLSPGMFVRIRLPIDQPHPALLVIDRAIQSDQGLKFVYVVDAEDKAQSRRITTGALQEDGLRVITSGLTADDRVVVGALQQVRPRLPVRPDPLPAMPSLGRGPSGDDGPAPGERGESTSWNAAPPGGRGPVPGVDTPRSPESKGR